MIIMQFIEMRKEHFFYPLPKYFKSNFTLHFAKYPKHNGCDEVIHSVSTSTRETLKIRVEKCCQPHLLQPHALIVITRAYLEQFVCIQVKLNINNYGSRESKNWFMAAFIIQQHSNNCWLLPSNTILTLYFIIKKCPQVVQVFEFLN